ncbi:hypothetical protein D9M68_899580 [compost metagenome]
MQALIVDIPPQQGQVGLIAEQPRQRFVGIARFDLHLDTRITLAEAGDLRQHVHRRIHCQHQAAGVQRTRVVQQLLCLGLAGEQALADAQ